MPVDPKSRFQEAREQAGLSQDQVAAQSGLEIGSSAIWDIERCAGDLENYSPAEIRKLCRLLAIPPIDLFAESFSEPPVSPEELVALIRQECVSRSITLEEFEDVVGWELKAFMDAPKRILEDMSVDGLKWLCDELRIDWRRTL